MNKKLVNYVRENLHQGYSMREVADYLRKHGWPEEDIEQALIDAAKSHNRGGRVLVGFSGLIAFAILGIIVWLFVISPFFVPKPSLTGQTLLATYPTHKIDESHITNVLNKLGAYKLHANPFTGSQPETEIMITDLQETYKATVENNIVRVVRALPKHPDVRFEVTQDAIQRLSSASEEQFGEVLKTLVSEKDKRGFAMVVLADQKDLLLKGYLALYTAHDAALGVTGGAIAELPLLGSGLTGFFVLVLVLWGAVLLRMALSDSSGRGV